jgi:hypothetical protein
LIWLKKKKAQRERKEINKLMGDCRIIAFDSEEIMEKRQLAVNLRMAAHETLLEADLLDDEIIKTLMGIKDVKSEKRVGRLIKNKRLGKKV